MLWGFASWNEIEQKPNPLPIILAFFLALIVSIFFFQKKRNNLTLIFPLLIITWLLAGALVANLRINYTHNIEITKEIKSASIEGVVSKIRPTPYGSQITLEEVQIDEIPKKDTPKSVRINFPKENSQLFLDGDRIRVMCDLFPLPHQIVPDGYNFRKTALFSGIGALGRATSEAKVISFRELSIFDLHMTRKNIYNSLIQNLGPKNGNFASALFLGETGGIDQTTLNNMRYAGVSHILCVSGLHLSLVASLFFLFSRILLNCSDIIANYVDIKKLSAFISIVASLMYLILTGMQIAASRAFIMVFCVMFSIIISKQPYALRSLAVACVLILTKNPEYVILPSFQLSFIAVLSLLAGFEYYSQYMKNTARIGGIMGSIKLYFFSNIYSSFLASLSTAPIVMYHFYVYSNYSLVANLVAVPIVGFLIMPAGIISVLLSPVGLSFIPLYIIDLSIWVIKYTVNYVVSLPYSVIYTGYVSNFAICFFMFGFFCLSLISSRSRYIGLVSIAIFCILFAKEEKPTFLVNKKIGFIAERRGGDKIIIYSHKISPFVRNFIANWYGARDAKLVKINLKRKITPGLNYHQSNITFDLETMELSKSDTSYPLSDFCAVFGGDHNIAVRNLE
ncbi:MAG: ComEC/Rec2 family competence protein [Rickettsiaceae bacterium]|nr:ComEC/Rec2 family competence protein [Rickettsiaceae bacterium]